MKSPSTHSNGSAKIAIFTLLASVICMFDGSAEERVRIATERSDILLIGKVSKWDQVQLRRTYDEEGVVAYRWEYHEYNRDRRGQGAYLSNTRCLLNLYSKLGDALDTKQVEVISESPGRLELKFTFEGDGEGSTLHLLASRTGDGSSVTFKGKGPLYDEFIKDIDEIRATTDNSDNNIEWCISIYPITEEKD